MKNPILKIAVLILLTVFVASCSNDDDNVAPATSIAITATQATGILKPNVIVRMYNQAQTVNIALSSLTVLAEATTNANGVANFDLTGIVTNTTPVTYYFAAFEYKTLPSSTSPVLTQININYPSYSIKAGDVLTGVIGVQ